jgi:hypothetical protein
MRGARRARTSAQRSTNGRRRWARRGDLAAAAIWLLGWASADVAGVAIAGPRDHALRLIRDSVDIS